MKNLIRKSERNYGVDALRIIAMFMIVVLHVLGQGGVLRKVTIFSAQYDLSWLLEAAMFSAVNCYALISGLFGSGKLKSILLLWLRVWFYSAGITLLFVLFKWSDVTLKDWLRGLLPVGFGQYWYFTAFIGMSIAAPLINIVVEKMPKKQMGIMIILLLFGLAFYPTLIHNDTFGLKNGMSAWWLMIMYLLGRYIGKYDLFEKWRRKTWLWWYLGTVVLLWGSRLVIEFATGLILKKNVGGGYLFTYTSPLVVVAAVALVQYFRKIQIPDKFKKAIVLLAPLSFSVYLIHVHQLVWQKLRDVFAGYADLNPIVLIFAVLGTAIGIFIACLAIDWLRELCFKKLKVKEGLGTLCDWCGRKIARN